MTSEKLGVLLVDVPEPRFRNKYYYCIKDFRIHGVIYWDIIKTDSLGVVKYYAYHCTKEEAEENFSQFSWVALEDLE